MSSPRGRLMEALADMPEEAFDWFVLACLPKAMPQGALVQIWPDGLGGFQTASRHSIEAVRLAAQEYVADKATPDPGAR